MSTQDFLIQALIYLLAAIIAVPVAKRIGLGSILGYLLAGIIIGPFILKFVGNENEEIMHFAEFGVVMMLFLIGLELQPSLLWKMRKSIFGLGGAQVIVSTILIALIAAFFNMNAYQSIAIGLILALSSTAIVLQTLQEKGLMKTKAGQRSFSVLLFQDIAVIPILAILPLFAGQIIQSVHEEHAVKANMISHLPGWQQLVLITVVISIIIILGKFLSHHLFRYIASSGLKEVFTAFSLFIIIVTTLAMNIVGLSPALGAFIAGVVLADNEYRHEVEAEIKPFKGLLLGIFFISVGASMNFSVVKEHPLLLIGLVFLLIAIKFMVLFLLGKFYKLKSGQNFIFSFGLAQAGEFAFVLISFSSQNAIFEKNIADILLMVVTSSMLITPLLILLNEKLILPRFSSKENRPEEDEIETNENKLIIAGYGKFGIVIGRFLESNGIKSTILDYDPDNIYALRKFGHKVYYGDATRPDLLETAGISKAKILIITFSEKEKISSLASYVKNKYPHIKVFARAYNIEHAFELLSLKVDGLRREVYDSGIDLGKQILISMGYTKYRASRAVKAFKYHDEEISWKLYELYKNEHSQKNFIKHAKMFSDELEKTLLEEHELISHEYDEAWDIDGIANEIKSSE